MFYPKTPCLWKRDPKTKQLWRGEYSCPEFDNIKYWDVTEKIDGTNTVIEFDITDEDYITPRITFRGRTKKSIIRPNLLTYLHHKFTIELFRNVFPNRSKVILFGEGYGGNIQAAGQLYSEDIKFILFDIVIGNSWLDREFVNEKAKSLGIYPVPSLGIMTKEEIIKTVESQPISFCSDELQIMEGVVCRPQPLMLYRSRTPITFKLRDKDIKQSIEV